VWWRLLLHGVKGAGGHGWEWAQDWRCEYGWYPSVGAGGQIRSYQQRAHVFWGCPCAQAVQGPVLESLPQGVSITPAQLWLLEVPSPCVRERDWWVLAMSALSGMSRFRRQFAHGEVAQVWEAPISFFRSLRRDITKSQR